MKLDYRNKGEVKIDMTYYVEQMLEDFPYEFKSTDKVATPANENLFNVDDSKLLDSKRKEIFHTFVAKALFLSKRGRPDIQPTVAALCTRVQNPNETDWNKLVKLMKYLNGTRDLVVTLRADNISVVKWCVDAAFAVHPDFRSHTGVTMSLGKGSLVNISKKQKINTKSSTTAELVAVDDAIIMILWTRLFLEAQGYPINKNILYQDNKSAILLEENGKKSSSQHTRHLNIRYFFVTDQVQQGLMTIQYCPTDEMVADFMSKPLQGEKFRLFRKEIMNL